MPFSSRRSSFRGIKTKTKPRVIYGTNFEGRNTRKGTLSSSSLEPFLSHVQPFTRLSVASNPDKDKNSSNSPQLHKILTKEDLEQLHQVFKENGEQKFNRSELRDLFEQFNIYFMDEQFEKLFLKINTNRDDLVDWDEFISYIMLGFEVDEGDKDKEALDPPIKEQPVMKRTHHRHQLVRIDFCPSVAMNRTISHEQGGYVVTASDGTVNFYSLNWDLLRTGMSPSPVLKVASTHVRDSICMPDVRILCIASSERDLRFYDISANNYALRLHITELPEIISTLHYYFSSNVNEYSKLTMGDCRGSVYLLEFNPQARGPFRSTSGAKIIKLKYSAVNQNKTQFICKEFKNLHDDMVRQVHYTMGLDCIFSAAETKDPRKSGFVILDLGVKEDVTEFIIDKGVTCFSYDEASEIIATGGLDCYIRFWSPYSAERPFSVLPGHHAGICYIFLQDEAKKCYSMDKEKIIKIWDVKGQCTLQTYIHLIQFLPDKVPLKSFYHDLTREVIIGGGKFAILKCCPLLRLDLTDGNTHVRSVSVVLYNQLFEVIVTCGHDSFIIVWNPYTGARLNLIKMAHCRMLHGERLRVEITAACFDPKQQLLLTGATDGTLKIWNFNNGFCVRSLKVDAFSEITAVFWVPGRILAVGWNQHVVEFADGVETEYPNGKHWDTQHSEEILCAAARPPHALVTTSYNGEIIFWKFETGQAFRKFNVEEPLTPKKIFYSTKPVQEITKPKYSEAFRKTRRLTLLPQYASLQSPIKSEMKQRKLSVIPLPTSATDLKQLSIQAILFLQTRPMEMTFGTLLTSLDNGKILIWNHHSLGGYMKNFNAVHMAGDSVCAMTTDETNTYLFTGSALGYIKTWLLTNYCVPDESKVHVSMPALRLKFPFLIKTAFLGRAKRSVTAQPLPVLLNSYKAHLKSITSMAYIDKNELLLTGSSDKSVRLWTLGGQYLGTLGGAVHWKRIPRNEPFVVNCESKNTFRIPPDIKREASFTTLQVLTNGDTHPTFKKKIVVNQVQGGAIQQNEREKCFYGRNLQEPILGKYFELPKKIAFQEKIKLDVSLPKVPIYSHLKVHKLEGGECIDTMDSNRGSNKN